MYKHNACSIYYPLHYIAYPCRTINIAAVHAINNINPKALQNTTKTKHKSGN